GMLQRLYLAQALLHSPEFLVLDEPTSNLDPKGILEVRKLIQRINREEGVTVLLSSHQLSEVEDLCNRVAIINRGRRIVESTVIELFQSEECRVEIQVERPEEALAFLRKLDWAKDAEAREGLISARIPRARRGELNGLLVRDGFVVHDFTERRPTLEDYFHQRIAEDAA
ncbi:ABC transporter ATP-binding protein, partial [Candidatus Sumerlaeota bacterium]|nr:ABC transporter ATP-binding protein [Candidatus Sumerlaeota bacterium]